MKKLISMVLAGILAVGIMTGCTPSGSVDLSGQLTDGVYRVEFEDFDSYGWKDFVEVTIADGELYEVVFDAVNEDGTKLKSEDESYRNQMEMIVGTYPAKFNKDLINQFISSGKVTGVDIVAGATESTGNFKTLVIAAMENAMTGDTEVKVIPNVY